MHGRVRIAHELGERDERDTASSAKLVAPRALERSTRQLVSREPAKRARIRAERCGDLRRRLDRAVGIVERHALRVIDDDDDLRQSFDDHRAARCEIERERRDEKDEDGAKTGEEPAVPTADRLAVAAIEVDEEGDRSRGDDREEPPRSRAWLEPSDRFDAVKACAAEWRVHRSLRSKIRGARLAPMP